MTLDPSFPWPCRRATSPTIAGTLLWLVALAPAQSPPHASTHRAERLAWSMGTTVHIVAHASSEERAVAASEAALQALEATEARLTTWRPSSELSRLNLTPVGHEFELSPATHDELTRAMVWARASRGAFQPALGALVLAWDLRGDGRVPSAEQLAAAVLASGVEAIQLNARSRAASRTQATATIDAGAFGKGAGLDAALATASSEVRLLLDLGGQIAWTGQAARSFEIAHPKLRDQPICRIQLGSRGSLATSGNSERGRTVNGEVFGHLLDPRTGMPAADFGSATVFTESALDADCLSTACFVLGPLAAVAWVDTLPNVELVVVETPADGSVRVRLSSGLRRSHVTLLGRARLAPSATPSSHNP